MSEYAIKTDNLSRYFDEKPAVKNLNLKIKRGEIYGFLGENGAGKSTTIKMLVTLLAPSSGEAEVFGLNVVKEAGLVREKIGVALQNSALDEKQTGRELLILQAKLYGMNKDEAKSRVDELLKLIDIGEFIDKRIKTYSGGMKRRVDLAAALIHKPEILFLDEPTTGLDPVNRNLVWQEVRRLNKDLEMTIFLTTQYLEEADQLADRVGILYDGNLVVEDSPSNLKKKIGKEVILLKVEGITDKVIAEVSRIKSVDKAELHNDELSVTTKSGSDTVAELVSLLHKHSVKINEVIIRGTTLDDVFLEVTGNRLIEGDNK
jgi:ABC-2 type transport system ATP-binding protein